MNYYALLVSGATRAFKKVSRRRRAKFETTSIHLRNVDQSSMTPQFDS